MKGTFTSSKHRLNPRKLFNSTGRAVNIIDGQVLREESPLNSSFTQNFIIPEEAKYLQFTILDAN